MFSKKLKEIGPFVKIAILVLSIISESNLESGVLTN